MHNFPGTSVPFFTKTRKILQNYFRVFWKWIPILQWLILLCLGYCSSTGWPDLNTNTFLGASRARKTSKRTGSNRGIQKALRSPSARIFTVQNALTQRAMKPVNLYTWNTKGHGTGGLVLLDRKGLWSQRTWNAKGYAPSELVHLECKGLWRQWNLERKGLMIYWTLCRYRFGSRFTK